MHFLRMKNSSLLVFTSKQWSAESSLYTKETIPYFLRDDLSKKHKSQESGFEAFWLEIVGSAN